MEVPQARDPSFDTSFSGAGRKILNLVAVLKLCMQYDTLREKLQLLSRVDIFRIAV